MPWMQANPVMLDVGVSTLCCRIYPNHPKGCPNFNKKKGCPPTAPSLDKILDLSCPIFAVWNVFPFGEHVEMMRGKHPKWTLRQLENCLYWQPKARKQLRQEVRKFIIEEEMIDDPRNPPLTVWCPEAHGVNVTATMEQIGIKLEWPPKEFAIQVVLIGEDVNGDDDL